MRYRISCPTCGKTISDSVVACKSCPWTHAHPCTCTPVENLEAKLLWQSLFLSLGGDPAMVGGAVSISETPPRK